ncbi:unnamed protein product [Lactuca saligna]|uniref:Uncharacterized protein n=1 Tax=Lactuca saligna TaxID=75948 RepID=A0AA35YTP8_LACSI|nr:unnamed protein product [Lactuca saligna]
MKNRRMFKWVVYLLDLPKLIGGSPSFGLTTQPLKNDPTLTIVAAVCVSPSSKPRTPSSSLIDVRQYSAINRLSDCLQFDVHLHQIHRFILMFDKIPQ